jgi:hypothetical protein
MYTVGPHMCYSSYYDVKLNETTEKCRWFCSVLAGGCGVQVFKLYRGNITNIKYKYKLLT